MWSRYHVVLWKLWGANRFVFDKFLTNKQFIASLSFNAPADKQFKNIYILFCSPKSAKRESVYFVYDLGHPLKVQEKYRGPWSGSCVNVKR